MCESWYANFSQNYAAWICWSLVTIYFLIFIIIVITDKVFFKQAWLMWWERDWKHVKLWTRLKKQYKNEVHFKYASKDKKVIKYMWYEYTLIQWYDGSLSIIMDGYVCEVCKHDGRRTISDGIGFDLSKQIAIYLYDKYRGTIQHSETLKSLGYYSDGVSETK